MVIVCHSAQPFPELIGSAEVLPSALRNPDGMLLLSAETAAGGFTGGTMTSLVWLNIPLAILLILAIVGIPLWMTFRHPERHPEYGEALAHFRTKAARAKGEAVTVGEHVLAGPERRRTRPGTLRPSVPGRRHSGAPPGGRPFPGAPGGEPRQFEEIVENRAEQLRGEGHVTLAAQHVRTRTGHPPGQPLPMRGRHHPVLVALPDRHP